MSKNTVTVKFDRGEIDFMLEVIDFLAEIVDFAVEELAESDDDED